MEEDDETWLTSALPSTATSSVSKGTQSDLDNWLSTTTSAIDFTTRSALSRKLKGYSDKKARRRHLRSASTVSLESVTEESPRKRSEEEHTLLEEEVTHTPIPLCTSSPLVESTVERGGTRPFHTPDLLDLEASIHSPFGGEEEEYCRLEMAALGLSHQSEGGGEVDGGMEREEKADVTYDDDDEFFDAASEFEEEDDEASNGRSRELESLVEEPQRNGRQQSMATRLGVTPRSSSVSPRLATIQPSPPKGAATRLERVSTEIAPTTPVTTLQRKSIVHNEKAGMSVSLHMPSGHLPPRRIPPGRDNGKSPLGGGMIETEKKVNLHEDLAKIQEMAREQEEALRREVMGSLSANDVSNGENDSRLISNSKSIEFVAKKEFHSRLPTPSRRVIPVRKNTRHTIPTPIPGRGVAVGGGRPSSGGVSTISESRPINGETKDDDCF